MGKVEAFTIDGLDMWFWSGDHQPPHFHVARTNQWEIQVFFLECTAKELSYRLKWGADPDSRIRRKILDLVLGNVDRLFEEWECKSARDV